MLGGSKKDGKLRRSELMGSGESSLAHHLCQLCASHTADMLRDALACDTVIEVAQGGADSELSFFYALSHTFTCACQLLLAYSSNKSLLQSVAAGCHGKFHEAQPACALT